MSSTGAHVKDRLSSLPDDVLSDILSLMPTKFALRTSALSKRWRYIWTLIRNFDFKTTEGYHSSASLPEDVEWVLRHCKTPQVGIFRVFLNRRMSDSYCLELISKVIELDICELDIHSKDYVSLPLSLFTCKTLAKLKLDPIVSPESHNPEASFSLPSFVNLPNLKTLDVVISRRFCENALKLIHGCPVLENLCVKMFCWNNKGGNYFKIPTLKRLNLNVDHSDYYLIKEKVVLNLPNLEYFLFVGSMGFTFAIEEIPSLIEAKASCEMYRVDGLVQLLKGISQAKSIFLNTKDSLLAGDDHLDLPMFFPNLKQLELEGYVGHQWNFIPQFLERSPELEHFSITKAYGYYWNTLKTPTCIRNLKTLNYTNGCYYHDLHFLTFILSHSRILKTLTVGCNSKSEEDLKLFRTNLTKLRKASRKCEIRFVGIWPPADTHTLPVTHKKVQTRPKRLK